MFQIVLSVGAPKSTCSQHTGSFVQPFKVSSGNLLQLRFTPSSCALRDNGRRHSTCSADSRTDDHTNQTPLHTPFRFTPLTLLIHFSNILKSHVQSFGLIGEGSRHTNWVSLEGAARANRCFQEKKEKQISCRAVLFRERKPRHFCEIQYAWSVAVSAAVRVLLMEHRDVKPFDQLYQRKLS